MPVGQALALIPRFAHDPNPYVETIMVGLAQSVDMGLLPAAERPNFARFVQGCFGTHAEALGFTPKAGESLDVRRLRPALLMLVAGPGRDLKLRHRAQELALKWLDDPKAVDPNVLGAVLGIAGHYGDKTLFDRMLAKAKVAKDPRTIQRLLGSLGSFHDPGLQQRALEELLTNDFDARRAVAILQGGIGDPACHQRAYDFMKQHFDALMAKFPPEFGINMPFMGAGFSDEAHRADVEAFFKDRVAKYPGAARSLAQTLEGIRIREAQVAAQQPGIIAFLKQY
jgi:alanyl aminopeptidase